MRRVQANRDSVKDGRGRHGNRANAIPRSAYNAVVSHIARFPARESHYSRSRNKHKRYLDSCLSISTMFKLFLEVCPRMQGVVSYEVYRGIFNKRFNIAFGYPRSDICDTCEEFECKISAAKASGKEAVSRKLLQEKELHIRRGDAFYLQQSDAVNSADDDTAVLSCDFQKNFPLPLTGVGPEYYKRQLWLHNFCVKNMKTGESVMFMYSENFARKGPNDTVACLLNYFEGLDSKIRNVILFLDNCAAQNKNKFLWVVLQSLVRSGRFDRITLNYPVPGHSRLPCDRDFGLIERRRRKVDRVLLPSHWVNLVRTAAMKHPFEVRYVQHALTDDLQNDGTQVVHVRDIKSAITPLLSSTASKGSTTVRGVQFTKTGTLVRRTMTGEYAEEMSMLKRGCRWDAVQAALDGAISAYTGFVPIKSEKYYDVQFLLRRVSLPPEATFYSSLTHARNAVSDD